MTFFHRARSHDREIWEAIDRLKEQQLSTQEQVDALTTAVGQVSADLVTAKETIQAELNKLETEVAAGNPPNLTALTEAVAALDPAVNALDALQPEV